MTIGPPGPGLKANKGHTLNGVGGRGKRTFSGGSNAHAENLLTVRCRPARPGRPRVHGDRSSAQQVINFIELPNEGGIHMTASGFSFADATIPGETFHISSPIVPGGYTPDGIV